MLTLKFYTLISLPGPSIEQAFKPLPFVEEKVSHKVWIQNLPDHSVKSKLKDQAQKLTQPLKGKCLSMQRKFLKTM